MKVIYLHHSGFLVESDQSILVFDAITHIQPHLLNKGKHHYFFASHSHGDHFSQNVLSYGTEYTSTYIFSDDIPEKGGNNIHYIAPYNQLNVGDLKVTTFGSTDLGVSFMVETEGKVIFHSGDLNWWDWNTDAKPHIDPIAEERDFKKEIASVVETGKHIDVAFVPVDTRLGASATKAAEYFYEQLKPDTLIPMHFWEDFSMIQKIATKLPAGVVPSFNDRNAVIVGD